MKVFENVKSCSVTWLANTYDKEKAQGIIAHYYLPESMNEFIGLCRELYGRNEMFRVVGATSNIYIRPDTNIDHLISIKHLNSFHIANGLLVCQCGVSVKRIVREMVKDGIDGYACMIDLPGTIGGAIYGHAGVSRHSIAQQLVDVQILLSDGKIKTFTPEELNFSYRSSALKRGELDGVILSCRLKRCPGDKKEIEREAKMVHEWRKKNQPGPSRNLGTTSLLTITKNTRIGFLLRYVAYALAILVPSEKRVAFKTKLIMMLMGKPRLAKYLFGLNRYMWMDTASHEYFDDYVDVINQLYVKPRLEIEVW